ncbi:MAG TPA: acyltransferase [Humisphaera sp.]|jgi:peptidoglycan/LPS O-acetylase OafA/YrhL|nr:acyltransferase [Humisphaera sp.]
MIGAEQPHSPLKADSGERAGRYVTIDALRGIAAVSVMFCHAVDSPVSAGLHRALPEGLLAMMLKGADGVIIFFVISGFVIAHSLRNVTLGPKGVGRFILRRQLRLDPPYWAAIGLTVVAAAAHNHFRPATATPLPSATNLFLSAMYINRILGHPRIVPVAWTLCIEVQFYLFFILLLAVGEHRSSRRGPSRRSVTLLVLTAVGSLAMNPAAFLGVSMTSYWCYFGCGVLCYWTVTQRTRPAPLWLAVAGFALALAYYRFPSSMIVGLVTLISLYGAGRMGRLSIWGSSAPLQYLGRISYSMYLVHVVVLDMLLGALSKTAATRPLLAICAACVGLALSIGVAHVFYLVFERPSIELAARFRSRPEVRYAVSDGALLVS